MQPRNLETENLTQRISQLDVPKGVETAKLVERFLRLELPAGMKGTSGQTGPVIDGRPQSKAVDGRPRPKAKAAQMMKQDEQI